MIATTPGRQTAPGRQTTPGQKRRGTTAWRLGALAILSLLGSRAASAQESRSGLLPPWTDLDDLPLPPWAASVVPKRGTDLFVFDSPTRFGLKRGLSTAGSRLPLFGAKRGAGCSGRWLLVGPMAWVCSDIADLSGDEPAPVAFTSGENGLPYTYFFTGREGTSAYGSLENAVEGTIERDLEQGWARVAIVEQRTFGRKRWGRTPHEQWVSMRDLHPANASLFHGEKANGVLDFAWVKPERAVVTSGPTGGATGSRVRFQKVGWYEEKPVAGGVMVRISADGVSPVEWMHARDLQHPQYALPPAEAGGARATERWIDVHLASQVLVAYEGTRPVYATLVSTGRGPQGSDHATPIGVHRVWVKIRATTMTNMERDDLDRHYSMEDVPYTQFFDKNVALHGAFWHRDFGRVRSHGCVNLSPIDARWLFDFTGPHVPDGWHAAYPTAVGAGRGRPGEVSTAPSACDCEGQHARGKRRRSRARPCPAPRAPCDRRDRVRPRSFVGSSRACAAGSRASFCRARPVDVVAGRRRGRAEGRGRRVRGDRARARAESGSVLAGDPRARACRSYAPPVVRRVDGRRARVVRGAHRSRRRGRDVRDGLPLSGRPRAAQKWAPASPSSQRACARMATGPTREVR